MGKKKLTFLEQAVVDAIVAELWEAEMSVKEFAAQIGVNKSTVHKWLSGTHSMGLNHLSEIYRFFDWDAKFGTNFYTQEQNEE